MAGDGKNESNGKHNNVPNVFIHECFPLASLDRLRLALERQIRFPTTADVMPFLERIHRRGHTANRTFVVNGVMR